MASMNSETATQISGERSSDSEKVCFVIVAGIGALSSYVAHHSDKHPAIVGAFYVIVCLYAVARIAEIKSEEPYLSILKRFVPLIGILAVVMALLILTQWLAIIASIILALFVVRALIKLYPEILQALLNLRATALTMAKSAWSWLRNNMHRICQVFSGTTHSVEVD